MSAQPYHSNLHCYGLIVKPVGSQVSDASTGNVRKENIWQWYDTLGQGVWSALANRQEMPKDKKRSNNRNVEANHSFDSDVIEICLRPVRFTVDSQVIAGLVLYKGFNLRMNRQFHQNRRKHSLFTGEIQYIGLRTVFYHSHLPSSRAELCWIRNQVL